MSGGLQATLRPYQERIAELENRLRAAEEKATRAGWDRDTLFADLQAALERAGKLEAENKRLRADREQVADTLLQVQQGYSRLEAERRGLSRLQTEQRPWVKHNFGERASWMPLMGAVEELGELAHAHLKAEQGIRGTAEQHEAAGKDAVADVVIYLADYCSCRGWDMEQIVMETWDRVKQRDWKRDKVSGGSGELSHMQSEAALSADQPHTAFEVEP